MNEPTEFHLKISDHEQSARPLDLLNQHTGLSRSLIKQAMSKGAVWRQRGKRVIPLRRNSEHCQDIEQLHFYYHPAILAEQALQAELLEDKTDYSVWVKPRGMRSQGSRYGDHCALVRVAEQQLSRPCRIVHRLDQDACGLILLAHNKAAARHLSELFAAHTIDKRYHIIVEGSFPSESKVVDTELDEKAAHSEFTLLNQLDQNRSLVAVKILSGRKHQVRRHAALLGFPLIGDKIYNPNVAKVGKREETALRESQKLQLCAQSLVFQDHHGDQQHYEIDSQDWLG
ncbi:RluA family pseudouridine synthase [uncultured Pseudoteredinibacter sp.]|uniref:RluA family pseudouridine synthase n=1 Tax=uncultured Pseudoteredinibacter sp. TaxID=1641701 RepID=UPI00262E00F9|nr:RluA family pseudouridine synthase [uncultured Pseudoteredinibacter sp.]